MKLDLAVVTSLLLTSVSANAVPQQERRHVVRVDGEPQQAPPVEDSTFDLWKRRGGGGGGGRGGGGGGGGSRGGMQILKFPRMPPFGPRVVRKAGGGAVQIVVTMTKAYQ